jgi:carboxymethylenebutenolidase
MHNITDSKEFLQKLSLCAFDTSTLAALLRFISPNYLDSISVKPNDSRLKLEFITQDSPKG